MRQGRGKDLEATVGGRVVEEHGGDLSDLSETFEGSVGVQITQEGPHSIIL